ncbi:unnamed protein product [Microthlaspi erraticum]|uniref:Chromo domain-containing protein n=1 Tax=Microthlaspi erraticum TaxID=1685480 RepID=A0A6D2JM32_9BRAS|nr:unnamed protein product [Microthlaspi erraticum]
MLDTGTNEQMLDTVVYGRDPPPLAGYELSTTPIQELDEHLATRDELMQELITHLHIAANPMKQEANGKHRDITFQVADWVFHQLQPYVFDVSLLKQRLGSETPTSGTLPLMRKNGRLHLILDKILDVREVHTNGSLKKEALVLWRGLSDANTTWEDVTQLSFNKAFFTWSLRTSFFSTTGE